MITHAEKVIVMRVFIDRNTTGDIAEYLVNLQESVEGLSKNMQEYQKAYIALWGEYEAYKTLTTAP
jgi:hypothetical protein